MGLAATQMRFLALTAKKSNCEYQGQQINQQRLNLANQSSTIYSTIADLPVPTPPNPANLQTPPVLNNSGIDSRFQSHGVTRNLFYNLACSLYNNDQSAIDKAFQHFLTGNMGNGFGAAPTPELMNEGLISSDDQTGLQQLWQETIGAHNPSFQVYDVSASELYEEFMMRAFGEGNYLSVDQLIEMAENEMQGIESFDDPYYHWANSYQYNPNASGGSIPYEQAYAQYEADLVYYNAQMAALEAESANVHQKDKKLELQLKRIDTEHSAISTELDTVKKILGDNIESSFKTFG